MLVSEQSAGVDKAATYEMIENLVPNNTRHLKALLASDRVDNHVSMNADKVLRVEDTIFILVKGIPVSGVLDDTISR